MAISSELNTRIQDMAARIRELREIQGFSQEQMAAKTEISLDEYIKIESGQEIGGISLEGDQFGGAIGNEISLFIPLYGNGLCRG